MRRVGLGFGFVEENEKSGVLYLNKIRGGGGGGRRALLSSSHFI